MWKEAPMKELVQKLDNLYSRGEPNWNLYARILHECVKANSLSEGRKVHNHMRRNQYKPDTYLNNMLISMYAKCGSIKDAYTVFQAMVDKDVISWNAMISGFAFHGQGQEAVDLFYQMQREGLKPNKNTFVSILSACGSPIVLELGEQIHSRITKAGYESDLTVGTALINMYCKCGSLELARKFFNQMRERNVVSWTAMISGYARLGHSEEAFLLFQKLVRSGIQPNKISFACILGACTNPKDLKQGQEIHAYIKQAGLEQELLVGNALISMYARCGSLSNARQVFDNMRSPNRISWNALIAGCGKSFMGEAFSLFSRMQQRGFEPDRFTYATLLAICADQADLERGKELQSQITRSGWQSDVTVATALISMYTKCGNLEEARKVFKKMPEKTVVTWNAYIAGCCRHASVKEAIQVFKQMRRDEVMPDQITFITLLNACSNSDALEDGRYIHDRIERWGMLDNNHVANALISMYGRSGSLPEAREVFYRIRRRDLGSWNAMIAAFVQHGAHETAFELFRKYQREGGKGDKYTYLSVLRAIANLGDLDSGRKIHSLVEQAGMGRDLQILTTLMRMYSKCRSLGDACSLFNKILNRDLVCWNAMLAAYAHNGHALDSLKLFQHMQSEGVQPDSATYTSLLNACAGLGALEHGKNIHALLKEAGVETDTRVSNALVKMYSKCGSLSSASQVFKKMSTRDINSWNGLIAGYCQNGRGNDALECYQNMLEAGVSPSEATFTSVLSSYAQLGEVDEGFDFLESIKEKWNMEPTEEHYACMVDGLGRAGLLKEAEEFIEEISAETSAGLMWESLLVACRVHQNVELAETAAEHLLDAKAQASPAVCEQLLSIYAAAARRENVSEIKTVMEETGMMVPKSSTMEVHSKLHTFTTNELNPEIADAQENLEEIVKKMIDEGFLLDPHFALHELQEMLGLFSHCAELLAVAYGLKHRPPGASVRCVTDSRVADLSHRMLKFISRFYKLEIFVRDASCSHNFRHGICSCGDYW